MTDTNFKGLLIEYQKNKTRVLVNGMGDGTTQGTILEVKDDYIVYELLEVQKEKKTGKEKRKREVKNIQISNIFDVGLGEVEKELSGFDLATQEQKEKAEAEQVVR